MALLLPCASVLRQLAKVWDNSDLWQDTIKVSVPDNAPSATREVPSRKGQNATWEKNTCADTLSEVWFIFSMYTTYDSSALCLKLLLNYCDNRLHIIATGYQRRMQRYSFLYVLVHLAIAHCTKWLYINFPHLFNHVRFLKLVLASRVHVGLNLWCSKTHFLYCQVTKSANMLCDSLLGLCQGSFFDSTFHVQVSVHAWRRGLLCKFTNLGLQFFSNTK